jgi:predicted ATP-dependent endonuclease of OLD family
MYLQQITIEGFKGFGSPFKIELAGGLNILVGENGVGKSAIIDAIRIILQEDEYGRTGANEHDYHQPFQRVTAPPRDKKIRINAQFLGLSQEEQIAFLPWKLQGNSASLTLQVEQTLKGRNKPSLWGGVSSSSIFEWELMDTINCIYLPPLRDAEARLRDGRGSRLARLLMNLNYSVLQQHKKEGTLHPLETKVKEFNADLVDDNNECISHANNLIRNRLKEAVGEVFGQDTRYYRESETVKSERGCLPNRWQTNYRPIEQSRLQFLITSSRQFFGLWDGQMPKHNTKFEILACTVCQKLPTISGEVCFSSRGQITPLCREYGKCRIYEKTEEQYD